MITKMKALGLARRCVLLSENWRNIGTLASLGRSGPGQCPSDPSRRGLHGVAFTPFGTRPQDRNFAEQMQYYVPYVTESSVRIHRKSVGRSTDSSCHLMQPRGEKIWDIWSRLLKERIIMLYGEVGRLSLAPRRAPSAKRANIP